jgi:hypothetical protein
MRALVLLFLGASLALALAPAWGGQKKLSEREKRIVRRAKAEFDKDKNAAEAPEKLKKKMQSNYD